MPPFYLKMKPPLTEKQPPLKSEAPFQEMIPWEKKTEKFHKNVIFSLGGFKIL